MLSEGFYISEYNFSVAKHQREWVMRCRLPNDALATTEEQLQAIEEHAKVNRYKWSRGSHAS